TNAQLSVSEVNGAGANVGTSVESGRASGRESVEGRDTDVVNNADPLVDALNVGDTLTDSFTYQVSDGAGGFSTETLTVTIHGTDDAPVAVADSGSANEAGITAGSDATGNVLANDTDVDNTNAQLSVSEVNGAGANVGTSVEDLYELVSRDGDGCCT